MPASWCGRSPQCCRRAAPTDPAAHAAPGPNDIGPAAPLAVTGGWIHSAAPDRTTAAFAAAFREEVERLAEDALQRILALAGDPPVYAAMRRAAKRAALHHFDARPATAYWDALYDEVA